jgi:hypothetical protein
MTIKDYSLKHLDLKTLVPQKLRNPMLSSLIDNLFNRFLTHDEAVPLYGYVGRKPTSPDDRTPKIPQQSVERDINALVPIFSFKVGTETYSFTAQDLIRKAEVLGISTDQSTWLYSQGSNYAPPIDFDRFTNFFNYYWVADALPNKPVLGWNPSLAPEYYTIAAPKNSDLDKLNVVTASANSTVLTGSGFYEQTWTVLFADELNFTVKANGPGLLTSEGTQSFTLPATGRFTVNFNVTFPSTATLLQFEIIRDPIYDASGTQVGYETFSSGDKFTITAPFISNSYSITPNVGPGVKGKLAAVKSLNQYQTINGVQLKPNDRVLIKNQGSPAENGIYVVKPGNLVRADDYKDGNIVPGALVFDVHARKLYRSAADGSWTDQNSSISNTNSWQQSNFWFSRSELADLGLDESKVIQAVRPIIQFNSNLELNTRYSAGVPVGSGGVQYEQQKTEFNEVPLFNIYRYDGTHTGKVSPIFFYAEDPTAEIDVALQRRVAKSSNASSDFLFVHGLSEQNSLLFYKTTDGALHTIWHPGYTGPEVVDQVLHGAGNGTLEVNIADPFCAQQVWTATAVNSSTFKIIGSKQNFLPAPYDTITVGALYNNGQFSALITEGTVPFSENDTFTFRIGNFETTRYVSRDADDSVHDFFGGPAQDTAGVGAWQVPRMFYNNVAAENNEPVPEGTLYSHFRGILANQFPASPQNLAFGGSIKLWSEQQNLLAALLMQRDLTPISIIDLAQQQYETATNTLTDLFFEKALQYMSDSTVLLHDSDTAKFLDFLLTIRAKDQDVRTILYDSTSPVLGFPATLPQLGISPLVQPGVVFDAELGTSLLRAHDGHLNPLYSLDQGFLDRLLSPGTLIKRSTGVHTPAIGSFTATPPARPFKGELWFYANELKIFNVLSDGVESPAGAAIGDFWYSRASNVLYVWNGSTWEVRSSILDAWVLFDPAEVLNNLQLQIEQRLFDGINPHQRQYFSESEVFNAKNSDLYSELKRELGTWAAANGYDPTAPDYLSTDAFTWNYKGGINFPSMSTSSIPARWYNVLHSHQLSVPGVLQTSRPNLEPWRLLGNEVKPAGWDSTYQAHVTPQQVMAQHFPIGPPVRAVLYSSTPQNTPLTGLAAVDGVQLSSGQLVLLVSEASAANNGIWSVSSGFWSRATTALVQNLVIEVQGGLSFAGTSWVLQHSVQTLNMDPVNFEQVRQWRQSMWSFIQDQRPTLKLSVDVNRDALLPPYVSASLPYSSNALTNSIPPNPAAAYIFGEGSPVETVWAKSIEYRYSLARALFRKDPLAFLGHCWGFEWVKVDGIMYDGFDIAVPGHQRFRLHGDAIDPVQRSNPISYTGAADLTLVYTGYTGTRARSFTATDSGGNIIGYVNEGESTTIGAVQNLLIEDAGKPFRLGDKFTLSLNGSYVLDQAKYVQFSGFGQTFAHALRASSIDTNQGYAIQAYKGWSVNLGYRAGGLVSTDDLRVFNDSEALPSSAYALRFKRSAYARDLWVQALRVQVVQFGSNEKAKVSGSRPTNDGSDWVFRVDGYNARYLGIEFNILNPAGEGSTFNALSSEHTDRAFVRYSTSIGTAIKTELPLTITGLQNVLNFLFGYADFLEAQGWKFNDDGIDNIDAETGRARNWQLEVEKLVDRVYAGINLGEGHVLNPFIDRIWLEQQTGLLSTFFDTALFDITGHPGVFDTLGAKISTPDLTVLRAIGKSQISAAVPMFSVHAQTDEFEHVFVFNNLSSPSTGEGLIYDPFSGARIATIKLNGRRQAAQTLRPEFGGHYLVGDEVKRNLQSSTDKIAQYYDTDHVFEDEQSTRHSLALLGFSPKEYMANLDLSERTQFNFWRGLIQLKGTNASVDAFLNNDRFQDAKIDEFWAYKIAEYGDSRSKVFPELKLSVVDTLQQFTQLQFDAVSALPGFTQISADDESRWFTLDDLNSDNTGFEAAVLGTYTSIATVNDIVHLPFVADLLVPAIGTFSIINNNTVKVLSTAVGSGPNFSLTGYGPATPKFNPIKLFNYAANELVSEIPQWHPLLDQHTATALEGINIISNNDPAKYNTSTQVLGNVNYDPLHIWGAKELGRVWWDRTNLDYVPYSDSTIFPTVDERLSRWGALSDFASVDVVEWVESTVPPAEYDTQARLDAGNADLDSRTKADGVVYGAKTYSRNRLWAVRPVAWSRAGVADVAAHPSFNGSFSAKLSFVGGVNPLAYLELGTFDEFGVKSGMRLGAWQQDQNHTRPLSEYTVLDFTKYISGVALPVDTTAGSVNLIPGEYTATVGPLVFTAYFSGEQLRDSNGALTGESDWSSYVQVADIDGGNTETIFIRTDRSSTSQIADANYTVQSNNTLTYPVKTLGVTISLGTIQGTYNTADIANSIVAALGADITVHDAARVSTIAGLSDPDNLVTDQTVLSNDPLDSEYILNNGVGWRAWVVPTQTELDGDSVSPNNTLRPYFGEFSMVPGTSTVIQDAQRSSLVLNTGEKVLKYKSTWSTWSEVKNQAFKTVQSADLQDVLFTVPAGLSTDRISLYVNGVALLNGTYSYIGGTITVPNIKFGSIIQVIILAFEPSAKELAFNPEIEDNILIQVQYKIDYQYVTVPVRNSGGTITNTKYYFWVKNRSTAARNKKLSVKSMTAQLVSGPSNYLTFQHISTTAPFYYDAITVSGLSYLVTQDNTFKLRFTRNFTLRDDPEQLDLKDTHVEWALIRPGQRTKIPEQLWNKIVDTAVGADSAGNTLPSAKRSSYDDRNGTRTRFGFGPDQVLAPSELVISTLLFTVLNTTLVNDSGTIPMPDYMSFLDFSESDKFFSTPASTRNTLTRIWNEAKPSQINELFFAVLNDIAAANYEMTDLFKTSRLAAYSIKVVKSAPIVPTYE